MIGGITDLIGADGVMKPAVKTEIAAALKTALAADEVAITQLTYTKKSTRARARVLAAKYDIDVQYEALFTDAARMDSAIQTTAKPDMGASLVKTLQSKQGGFFQTQTPSVELQKAVNQGCRLPCPKSVQSHAHEPRTVSTRGRAVHRPQSD